MFTDIKATDGTEVDQPDQPEVPSGKPEAPADALTASFVSKDLGLENAAEFISKDVDSVSFAATNDGGKNTCKYYANGEALRFYATNSFVITAKDGAKLSYIEIVTDPSNGFNDERCEYTNAKQYYEDDVVVLVPTEGATEVSIKNVLSSGNFRVISITVYYTK